MADQEPSKEDKKFNKEYAIIEKALDTNPYVVRHYLSGTTVGNVLLDFFTNDDNTEKLSGEFCAYEIQGGTISTHAAEAIAVSILYDKDSYYSQDPTAFRFAGFALLMSRSPYQRDGEKVLYVDIICTSQKSRDEKKRYGESLLKSIETLAKDRGFEFTELDSIDSATGFYEKMGYTGVGEGDDGTVMRKSLKPAGGRLRLKTLRRSRTKEKKWDAVFDKDGKEKVVPFGQRGYSDFTKHKDTKRRQRYIDRHSGMGENWRDPTTPGALSRFILWNKKTLRASLRDFKKKFRV